MKIRKQEDIKDCGLVVFQSIYHYFNNQWISLSELKKDVFFNSDGIVIKNLQNLGKKWGIALEAYNGDFQSLIDYDIKEPIIIIINENDMNHYVILERKDKKYFYLLDPLVGKRKVKYEEFNKIFQNIIITTQKLFDVKIEKKYKNLPLISFIKEPENYFVIFLIVITSILNFSSAFFLKSVIEKSLAFKNIDILIKITLLFLWIFIFKFIQNLIKNLYTKKLQNNIEYKILNNFLYCLKVGNNSQLIKLETSDYIKRFQAISSFSSFVANFIFSLFGELTTLVFSIVILLYLNFKLFLISLIIAVIFLLISFIYKKCINKKYNSIIKRNSELNSSYFDFINNLFNLKNEDFYKLLNHKFMEKFFSLKQEDDKLWKISFAFKSFQKFLTEFMPILIIFISSLLVIQNNFQLADMILYITFFNSFISPLNNISDLINYYPIFSNEYDLLKFILFIPKEKNGIKIIDKINSFEIENLDYKPNNIISILKIKKMQINENLHIIGKNGTGKSTLLKILNLENEIDQNFKINNLEIKYINKEEYRKRVIYISSNLNSISSDLLTYITDGNYEKMQTFFSNIQYYNLNPFLKNVNLELTKEIKQGWINFSSGQRQIILLLKLFTKKYDLILLDEAFENISLENFQYLKTLINDYQNDAIFLEVSHSKKYIKESKEVDIEKL
ncbi:Mbov_0121 family peptidase domain-containing ABC transporter [Mesomycoplasma lagogenitalium]|uniref:Cysteine peptidase family C39 domain-containing protein n=1 Tax=Mesomycoplasma lagogenitalium TaxID=171286 RepID=A0ABY8LUK8_9BACT|nr:cysteine peptidase family C39 domain-containing protein [Mesomycoplasma lagogenitalium]WGI36919.1 cysteine peptidase family C39 domain-containing protein [Mesomycoplasma lagogenitalium]